MPTKENEVRIFPFQIGDRKIVVCVKNPNPQVLEKLNREIDRFRAMNKIIK